MIRRLTFTLRNITAGLLLAVATVGAAELTLRINRTDHIGWATPRAAPEVQALLRPSASLFHELIPAQELSSRVKGGAVADDFRVSGLGYRGEDVAATPAAGTYRILVLGDDSICAPWLPEAKTLPRLLAEELQSRTRARLEVINGAVPGDCPLLAWLRYESVLASLNPHLVILHVDMSDIADDSYYRGYLTGPSDDPVCRHPALDAPSSAGSGPFAAFRQSALAEWVLQQGQRKARNAMVLASVPEVAGRFSWIADEPPDLRLQILHALQPILKLNDAVTGRGGQLLVTTAPVLWQITDGQHAPELTQRCQITGVTPYRSQLPFDVLRQYCEYHQVHYSGSPQEFANIPDPHRLFSTTQPVLSAAGVRLYAMQLARSLERDPPVLWTGAER